MTNALDITDLLTLYRDGDTGARDRLAEMIYPHLKKIAGRRLSSAVNSTGQGAALQTTELVNETFLLLQGQRKIEWRDRAHFFAIAARLMRRALVESARFQGRAKRGDGQAHVPLDSITLAVEGVDVESLALDQAMSRLMDIDPRAARVVELRYFSGMSLEEVAEALGLGRATVARSWRFAKSWLLLHLRPAPPADKE